MANIINPDTIVELRQDPIQVNTYWLYLRDSSTGRQIQKVKVSPYLGDQLPNYPSTTGDYYLGTTISTGDPVTSWTQITSELPPNPTTDGVYHLTNTITGGVSTLSWEL